MLVVFLFFRPYFAANIVAVCLLLKLVFCYVADFWLLLWYMMKWFVSLIPFMYFVPQQIPSILMNVFGFFQMINARSLSNKYA